MKRKPALPRIEFAASVPRFESVVDAVAYSSAVRPFVYHIIDATDGRPVFVVTRGPLDGAPLVQCFTRTFPFARDAAMSLYAETGAHHLVVEEPRVPDDRLWGGRRSDFTAVSKSAVSAAGMTLKPEAVWFDTSCPACAERGPGPSHRPSPLCESGKRPHCTCDSCF